MPAKDKAEGLSKKAEEKTTAKTAAKKPTVKKTVAKKPAAETATEAKTVKPAAKVKIDPILHKLLEAGAHFGHQSSRWNPKMAKYIYTTRGGVHIIDLTQTAQQLAVAKKFVEDITKNGGKILFVSTKRQAKAAVQEAAKSANMPYVTYRWLGGMLTNLETIQKRVLRLKKLRTQQEETSFAGMSKKDRAGLERELELLERTFSGIADMEVVPAAVFVVDMPREHTAILEARKLGIPVLAICDTNADPDDVDYPIPANDDAISAISLITSEVGAAAASGAAIHATKVAKETPVNQGEDK